MKYKGIVIYSTEIRYYREILTLPDTTTTRQITDITLFLRLKEIRNIRSPSAERIPITSPGLTLLSAVRNTTYPMLLSIPNKFKD
jgi:hypothetical protein